MSEKHDAMWGEAGEEIASLYAEVASVRQLNMRLRAEVEDAQAVCDSYAKENQQFHDEIERLRLQWTGMKDEVNLCHAKITRLRTALEKVRVHVKLHERDLALAKIDAALS